MAINIDMNELIPVPNYRGYKANRKGQIWSDFFGGRFLKQQHQIKGYVQVTLVSDEGKRSSIGIHRVIAKTFLPNPNNLPQIHHLNGLRDDNNVFNLAWVTKEYNIQERWERNRKKKQNERI